MDHFRFANGSRAKMGEKTVHRYVQKGTFVIISKNLRMLYLDCERCGEPGRVSALLLERKPVHCAVSLGKTLNLRSAYFKPGV